MTTLDSQTGVSTGTALFPLKLVTVNTAPGAPVLHLNLLVDSASQQVTGHEEVTQALAKPVVSSGHVSGPLIYEYVQGPGSKIRIDLTGYPIIHWPPNAGIGPVIPPNFRAIVVLDTDYSSGTVHYEYLFDGIWHRTEQAIKNVSSKSSPIVALYAATLNDAAISGNLARLKELHELGTQQLTELQAGLNAVQDAINKHVD